MKETLTIATATIEATQLVLRDGEKLCIDMGRAASDLRKTGRGSETILRESGEVSGIIHAAYQMQWQFGGLSGMRGLEKVGVSLALDAVTTMRFVAEMLEFYHDLPTYRRELEEKHLPEPEKYLPRVERFAQNLENLRTALVD